MEQKAAEKNGVTKSGTSFLGKSMKIKANVEWFAEGVHHLAIMQHWTRDQIRRWHVASEGNKDVPWRVKRQVLDESEGEASGAESESESESEPESGSASPESESESESESSVGSAHVKKKPSAGKAKGGLKRRRGRVTASGTNGASDESGSDEAAKVIADSESSDEDSDSAFEGAGSKRRRLPDLYQPKSVRRPTFTAKARTPSPGKIVVPRSSSKAAAKPPSQLSPSSSPAAARPTDAAPPAKRQRVAQQSDPLVTTAKKLQACRRTWKQRKNNPTLADTPLETLQRRVLGVLKFLRGYTPEGIEELRRSNVIAAVKEWNQCEDKQIATCAQEVISGWKRLFRPPTGSPTATSRARPTEQPSPSIMGATRPPAERKEEAVSEGVSMPTTPAAVAPSRTPSPSPSPSPSPQRAPSPPRDGLPPVPEHAERSLTVELLQLALSSLSEQRGAGWSEADTERVARLVEASFARRIKANEAAWVPANMPTGHLASERDGVVERCVKHDPTIRAVAGGHANGIGVYRMVKRLCLLYLVEASEGKGDERRLVPKLEAMRELVREEDSPSRDDVVWTAKLLRCADDFVDAVMGYRMSDECDDA